MSAAVLVADQAHAAIALTEVRCQQRPTAKPASSTLAHISKICSGSGTAALVTVKSRLPSESVVSDQAVIEFATVLPLGLDTVNVTILLLPRPVVRPAPVPESIVPAPVKLVPCAVLYTKTPGSVFGEVGSFRFSNWGSQPFVQNPLRHCGNPQASRTVRNHPQYLVAFEGL